MYFKISGSVEKYYSVIYPNERTMYKQHQIVQIKQQENKKCDR